MKLGDEVRMYHRANTAFPVRSSDDKALTLPADGGSMTGTITRFVPAVVGHQWVVDLDCVDAAGQEFKENGVVILPPESRLPRGGRFALLADDDSEHPPADFTT